MGLVEAIELETGVCSKTSKISLVYQEMLTNTWLNEFGVNANN